jgi:hypothetical protein
MSSVKRYAGSPLAGLVFTGSVTERTARLVTDWGVNEKTLPLVR